MSDQAQDTKRRVSLSADDLPAALRLLNAEGRAEQIDRRTWMANFLFVIVFAVVVSSCPLGLIAVVFKVAWGWVFLVLALTTAVALFVLADADLTQKVDEIRNSIQASALGKAAITDWDRRNEDRNCWEGCLLLLNILLFFIGIIWFAYDAVTKQILNLTSVALTILTSLIVFVLYGIGATRDYRYFSRVLRLQERLQRASTAGDVEVPLSSEEVELLSRVETQQVNREVAKAVRELPQNLKEAYSVTIMLEPLEYLGSLTEQQSEVRSAIREITNALQVNPRPSAAHPVPNRINEFVISTEDYEIRYSINDVRKRVEVIAIHTPRGGEAGYAS